MRINIKKLIPVLLGLIFIILPIKAVYAETLEEQLNNMVGPKVQYDTMLSPVYLRTNTTEESISPQSGGLTISQTDYVLPGIHGLDLEFKRIYKSGTSNMQDMKVKYVKGAWVDYTYSDANTSSFYEDRYDLGVGMRFSFPEIEVRTNTDNSKVLYLHNEAGDIYELQESTVNNEKVYLPENQTIKDVEIRITSEYTNGQSNGVSKYKMTGKDGKDTYFAEDGRILGIVDRYGSSIKFEYTTQSYQIDGVSRTKKLINKITDSIGRVVTIDYNEDYSYTVGVIENKQYTLEDSYKASQNPNTTDSGDLNGKFQVVINLPGDKKIVYDKSAALVNSSKQVIRTRLQRVYDVDGQPKYHFWYDQPELGFTYTNGTSYSSFNRYENLVQIDYCKTNRIKRYVYDKFKKGLSDKGSMEYQKVFEQEELVKKDFDNSQAQFVDKFVTEVKDKNSYQYTNEADGFGTAEYNANNKTYLEDTYRYSTVTTDMGGNKTSYSYNGIHELVDNETSGANHKEKYVTEYDEMKFPKKKEVISYNVDNGQFVKKIENYRYDEYGNLTNYTGPLANRDENGYPTDEENTIVYSYAYDKFHTPVLKTWKQDADTTCQIINTVNDKGNVIKEQKVLTGDPKNWVTTDYQYDNHGNLIKKDVNSPENKYTTFFEYGVDEDGTDTMGAFLTREYSVQNGKEISKKYTYDLTTGNKKSERDANGNRTSYEYDILGRLVKSTNPDSSYKTYSYTESVNANRKINFSDAKGTMFSNTYDILGNLVKSSVYDEGQWKTLKEVEYDYQGNKTKEIDANGHSARFTYDSAGQLIKKSFYENDKIEKADINLAYTIAYDTDTPLLLTITDEEGFIKKYYYNILNQLIKLETTADNTNFNKTTYSYDYSGNKVSETDATGNSTFFDYDELGRLVKKTDAALNETVFTYNGLDKPLTTLEPNNKLTTYIYDSMGRTVEERISEKGASDYVYKKYDYDNAGNVTSVIQSENKDGQNILASKTEYSYNNMNRVTDEYRTLDDSKKARISYTYDNNGNKISSKEYIDEAGNEFLNYEYAYDFAGRQMLEKGSMQQEGADGEIITNSEYITAFKRDNNGNVLKEKKYNGSGYDETIYSYNYINKILSKTEPFKKDGATKTTELTYDKKGNIKTQLTTVNGDKVGIIYEYDGLGRVVSKSDVLGNTIRYVYDAKNNLIKEIDQRYQYEDINKAPGIEYEYDTVNRQTKVIAFDGTDRTVISYKEYDGRGNVIKEVDAAGYNTQNPAASYGAIKEYDVLNNLVKATSAETAKGNTLNGTNNFTRKFSYDGAGRLISEEDALGGITTYEYFLNGKLKRKTDPDSFETSYDYDLTGKSMVKASDKAKNITTTWSNIFGKPYRIEYPDGTTETFSYTQKGDISSSKDKAGSYNYYDYDPSGNMLSKREYIDDGTYSLTVSSYNEANNLVSAEIFQDKDGSSTSMDNKVTYIYDKVGRITGVEGPNGREVLKEYDAKGNLVTEKAKVREGYYDVKRYTYDLLSRVLTDTILVEMQDVDLAKLSNPVFDNEFGSRLRASNTYTYYDNGQLKTKRDANGNETSFVYDLDKHLLEQNEIGIGKQAYKYDLRGNMVEQTNSLNVTTFFDYDTMGRLIRKKAPAADGSMAVNIYIYDANGNLKKSILPNEYKEELDTPAQAEQMAGTSYEYDSMNRRVSTLSPEGAVLERIKYNALGKAEKLVDGLRLTEDFDSSKGTVYAYDSLERLTQKTDALGNVFKYEYDVLGRLLKETDPKENSTEYKYGSDGTLISKIFADNSKIEYTYDKLGRQTGMKDQRGYTTNYTYTALGKIKTQTDAESKALEFVYDLNGNIISQKDKRGNTSYFGYDAKNRITEKKAPLELDAAGNVVFATESYVYDSEGNVLRKSNSGTASPDSKRETYYSYYPNNLVKTVSTSSGASTTSSYDKNGNVVMVEALKEEGKYNILKYQYDIMNRLIKKITLVDEDSVSADLPLGGVKDVGFPGMILLISGFSYDILGNKRKEYSPMAFAFAEGSAEREEYAVNYSYDALNRLESVSRKFGAADAFTKYYYDAVGNKERAVNELGNETTYAYDSMNRLVTQTDSYSNTYSYKYDEAGNKVQETNSKEDSVSYTYDSLNRLETVIDPYGTVITKNIYDANCNITKVIDAKGYLSADNDEGRYGILNTYDLANRLVKVVDPEIADLKNPDKFTFKYVYSQFGERLSSIDALGNSTDYEYDNAGMLTKVTTQQGEEVSYGYDKAGNKVYMVDGRGKITRYAYGAMNLLKAVTDADGKEISYRYDLNGNIAEVTDRKGNTTRYSYDNRNLLLEKNVAETGDKVSFTYDAAGNRAAMKDESGETAYTYDKNNRLLEIFRDGSKQISYTYDTVGNIEAVTDFKGFATNYSYDKSNRMQSVSFNGITTNYSYDKNGNRESVEYQGGVKEAYSYDKNNKLLTLINKRSDGSEISKYSYTYYENGLQKTKTDRYGTTEYIYDAAGRVLKVTTPGKTTVYAYDKSGNRLSQNETYTSNQPTGTVDEATGSEIQYIIKKSEYVYTNTNQLLKLTEKMLDSNSNVVLEKNTTYFYDDNGNQLNQNSSFVAPHTIKKHQSIKGSAQGDDADEEISALIERTSNTFDGFNRLKKIESVKDGVRTIAEYSYNGDDLRVRKSVKKSDEQYEEKVTNYLYDRQYVILETDAGNAVKARCVKGVNYIARLDASNNPSYFLFNGHGDVVQTVTASGEVQNQYDYDIWGNPTLTVESYDCGIRYAGEYLDSESGLYYLRARYYDSYTSRFISEDSYWGEDSNPLSLNRYTYGHNDPINFVDPTGHWEEGDSNLTNEAQAKMLNLTNKFYEADSDILRGLIKEDAKKIRENANNYVNNTTTSGQAYFDNVKSTGKTIENTIKSSSDGYVTSEQWDVIKNSKYGEDSKQVLYSGVNGADQSFGFWAIEDNRSVNWHFGDETTQLYSSIDGYALSDEKGVPVLTRYDRVAASLQDGYMTAYQKLSVFSSDDGLNMGERYGDEIWKDNISNGGKIATQNQSIKMRTRNGEWINVAAPDVWDKGEHGKGTDYETEAMIGWRLYNEALAAEKIKQEAIDNAVDTNTDGLKKIKGPTVMEAAKIADNIYNGKVGDKVSGGWTLTKIYLNNEGLRMGIYERTKEDGLTKEYVIANAGTEMTSATDWINNVQQPLGSSTDMYDSTDIAGRFVNEHPFANITFVGHSKGGAEATANAVKTNKNAIVFNPATVNLDAYGLDSANYSGSVTAYVVVGDILNSTEGNLAKPFGKIVYLPRQYSKPYVDNMIKNHLMDAVIKAIQQKRVYDLFDN